MSRLDAWIMYDPKPYRPLGVSKTTDDLGGPVEDPERPWLALRLGETPKQWHARMSCTCYRCGEYIEDQQLLDAHEESHAW